MIQKLIDRYHNLSAPIKMSFWFLICSFLQKGIGMLTTPIFTRVMVDSEFGRYNVYTSWLSILSVFVTLSISGNFYTRGLVLERTENRDKYTSSLQSLTTVLIVSFYLVYLLLSNWINKYTGLSTYMFTVMFVEMLMTSAFNFWINRHRVDYEYKAIVILTVLFAIIRPLVSVLFVLKAPVDMQVEYRLAAILLVNIGLFLWIYIINIGKGKVLFSLDYWKSALVYCIPLVPHYFSSVILSQSDRLMIDNFCGSNYVAYYSVAYSIGMVVQVFNGAVSSSFNPWIYKAIKNKEIESIGRVSYVLLSGIALLNIVMVGFAPEILKFMAPSNYNSAIWAIPPITLSVYFMFMYDLFASFQFFFGKTNWIAFGTLAAAVVNVILNFMFIPKFGYVAAGYTTLTCYVLYGVFHYFFMKKVCKQFLNGKKVYDGKLIVGIALLLFIGTMIMMLLYRYLVIRIGIILVIGICAVLFRKQIIQFVKLIRSRD